MIIPATSLLPKINLFPFRQSIIGAYYWRICSNEMDILGMFDDFM